MAKLLKLRFGVADDPTARQPSLNDCLEAMLPQSDVLVTDMLAASSKPLRRAPPSASRASSSPA